jgi:hypothetical protein
MDKDEFYEMRPSDLARIYKRQKIDEFLNELHSMQELYIEEALAKSNYRETQELLDYIRKKC